VNKTLLPELQDPEARIAVAEALLALFERWQLHEVNQAQLLGLNSVKGLKQKIVQAETETMERAGYLLAIDRALRQRTAAQAEREKNWIFTPNDYLSGLTPLSIMLEDGLQGIMSIRDMAESKH
jgi:myo-inositol catabolism protein IolC